MRALLSLATVATAATLLAGCGSADDTATDPAAAGTSTSSSVGTPTSGTTSAPAVNLPDCARTWKVGATIPAHYKGCQVGGTKAKSFVYRCEIGAQIATYGDLYAIVGRKVVQASPSLRADADWKYLYDHCVG